MGEGIGRVAPARDPFPTAAWLLSAGLLFFVTLAPFAYAWRAAPSDLVYTGLMFDVPDHAQYWSWVTASRRGVFIPNTMTPEPNPATFLNPMMWLLARVQDAAALSFAALFQVWRVLGTLLAVLAAFVCARTFLEDRRERRLATFTILCGAGFGWVAIALKYAGLGDPPSMIYTVEPNTFFAILAYPYLAIAQGLVALTLAWVYRAFVGPSPGRVLLAGLCAMLLAVSHAYDLLTVYATIGLFGLWQWGATRRLPWRLVPVGGAVAIVSAPIALYYRHLTTQDALWRAILAQYANAGVWTPGPLGLIVLVGAPLLLALAAMAWRLPRGNPALGFVVAWLVAGGVLIYLPVVYQIKLLAGWQFPVAVLAVVAWCRRVEPRVSRVAANGPWRGVLSARVLATVVFGALVLPTNAYLLSWRFVDLGRFRAPYFLHRDEVDVLQWLATNGTGDDVVLAPVEMGQFVPNYGETRAYLAHWAMTNRFFERRENVARFFDPATPDAWRESLLARERVSLVVRPWAENDASRFDPVRSPWLEPILTRPRAQLYRYRPVESASQAMSREP